ncbi:MAG: alpha/beta hydrolase [Erysipelotrichaceae bacterium]|nr:alpha/beta hydrolase [Erysipelotrichaceae bacterium]
MSWENVLEYRRGCKESDEKRDAGLTQPEDIKNFRDIAYGPHKYNMLDVYVPKGTKKKLPAIISIHGGGWVYGDKELYQHYCMRLAQRGFAVVNFSYRLAPEDRYPAAVEDCFAVFRWVRENHEKYFIDYDNMFMVGDSAGGQLALQCLTILTNSKYRALFDLEVPEDFTIRACGLNCGAYYLMVNRFMKPSDRTFMKDYLPEDYEKYIPQLQASRYITSEFPPAFVMTAHNDFLKTMAKPLYWKLKLKNVECEYHIYGSKDRKDIGHVFHVNCRLDEADRCNDDECAFFRRHMV